MKAREAYKVLDEILRRGDFEAKEEGWDTADLILANAYRDASQQLNLMWYWGWINSDTANKFADYFGIDF